MSDNKGLQHAPARPGLSIGGPRAAMLARGRQELASTSPDDYYKQAAELYRAGEFSKAAALFRIAAEAGHAESQYVLSEMYEQGTGIPADSAQAAQWERRAADQGHAYAQANASFRAYSAGRWNEAFTWCRRAAESGLVWAQFHLGLMFRKGEGTEQDDAQAAHWYQQAALQGDTEAAVKLAEMLYFGTGVRQNHAEAAAWYTRAASAGNAEAQFQLGHLYSTGLGVEVDYGVSRMWIQRAARAGHAAAVTELRRRQYRDP